MGDKTIPNQPNLEQPSQHPQEIPTRVHPNPDPTNPGDPRTDPK